MEDFKDVIFFIEATSFEQYSLWLQHKSEVVWEQISEGFWMKIGEIGRGKPVCLSFSFAKIYGKKICFYDVTSRYSDSKMVENFLVETHPVKWDNGTRRAMTNAMNFHHVISAAKEYSQKVNSAGTYTAEEMEQYAYTDFMAGVNWAIKNR